MRGIRKTDVQPLINEGADKADIAASIFQAVVNQTIAGLAAGRKIKGKVAFRWPLYFMSELRRRFVETLQIAEEDIIFPENPQLFVAIGAALYGEETAQLNTLLARLSTDDSAKLQPSHTLAPLFATEEELAVFRQRHGQSSVEEKLASHTGAAFLGIDAGSTTTKVVLIDEVGRILYSFMATMKGSHWKPPCGYYRKCISRCHQLCSSGKLRSQDMENS